MDLQRLNQMVQGALKGGLLGGELGFYGLLRQVASAPSARPFELLSSAEKVLAICQPWAARARKEKAECLGVKLIFDLDSKFDRDLAAKGVPTDETLAHVVVSCLRRYQQRFFPGQQLGFLLSVRSVGGRTQAWVLLYPASSRGTSVVTMTSKGKLLSADHARFIEDAVRGLGLAVFLKKVQNPVCNFASPDVDPIQEQLLTRIAYQQLEKSGKSGDDLAKFLPNERTTLALRPDVDVRPLLKDAYDYWTAVWTKTEPEQAGKIIDSGYKYVSVLDSKLKETAGKNSPILTRQIREIRNSGNKFAYFPTAKSVPLGRQTYRIIFPKISQWIDDLLLEPWGTQKPLGEVVEQAQLEVATTIPELPSLLDPLGRNLAARSIVQKQLQALKIILRHRIQTSKVKIETAMAEKAIKVEQVRRLRLLLHLPYLSISVAKAKIRGQLPDFLRHYDLSVQRGHPISVRISRRVPGDPESLRERSRRRRDELREVKPLATGETLSNPLYRHHSLPRITSPSVPLVTESVFNQDLTGRGPDSVTSEIDEDRTPQEILDSPVEKEILRLIDSNSAAFRDMLRTHVNRYIKRSSMQQVLDENSPDEFIKAGL